MGAVDREQLRNDMRAAWYGGLLRIPNVALPEREYLPHRRGGTILSGAHDVRHRARARSDDAEALAVLHLADARAPLGDVPRVRHHHFDVLVLVVLADVARIRAPVPPRRDVRRDSAASK